ncbi:MAG: YeeE/YedE thiosulfate transporter family protein [Bacteroidales bacterium]
MAPFIPEGLVNPQLNLFFALILGIGFGYTLEQAGFSSARKLAGLFYGYDFVVLRVFFTAGITAMTGLLFLNYMGWVDMSLVYINPFYVRSAVLGGAIMGLGFILGGYCPGTSIVAATVGKIDAMLFIAGAFVGIFIFGHYYPNWESFYNGYFVGTPFVYESLGISRSWFAFLMVMMAVTAFFVTQKIEDNVNDVSIEKIDKRPSYVTPAMLLIISIFIFLFLPEQRRSNAKEISPEQLLKSLHDHSRFVDAEEVAYKIIENKDDFFLIDVRDSADFHHFALPGAVNIQMDEILGRTYRDFFNKPEGKKIFYGFGDSEAELSWAIAARAGFEEIYILKSGLNGMFEMIFETELQPRDSLNLDEQFEKRFIARARDFFLEGKADRSEKPKPTPVKQIIDLQTPGGRGGC